MINFELESFDMNGQVSDKRHFFQLANSQSQSKQMFNDTMRLVDLNIFRQTFHECRTTFYIYNSKHLKTLNIWLTSAYNVDVEIYYGTFILRGNSKLILVDHFR